MALRFSEAKATQAAGFFLALRDAPMSYMKLIKLLYLTDRQALVEWGIPVTTDRYVSMDNGPVVSNIYSLVVEDRHKPIWDKYISAPLGQHEVKLLKPTDTDLLSRAEERLMGSIFDQFGHMDRWKIVDYVHTLPEWQDPHGSSTPIEIRDILRAAGRDEADIRATVKELHAMRTAEDRLARLYA